MFGMFSKVMILPKMVAMAISRMMMHELLDESTRTGTMFFLVMPL